MIAQNEGKTDRIVRVILGAGLIAIGFYVTGIASIVLWVVGAILVTTGATGFCGLYSLFKINTCEIKKK